MPVASDRSLESFALVGRTLGDTYLIEGVIGSGPHGTLYAARHLRLACRCTVKVLAMEPGPRRQGLLATLGSLAGMAHPHLLPPRDVLQLPEGPVLLSSPLLEGEDLASRVALRGRLTQAEGMLMVRQTCAGLLALHRRGLAHGNLTPTNVFFARYDDVAIDNALGGSAGAQMVVLLDMGLTQADGASATGADDQRGVAQLVRDHVADLTAQQIQALERAQSTNAKTRFASVQDLWKALLANAGPGADVTASLPMMRAAARSVDSGALQGASSATAVVTARRRGPVPPSGDVPDRRAALRRLVFAGSVGTLVATGGVVATLAVRQALRGDPAVPGPGGQRPSRPPPPPPPPQVTLRFALSPPSAVCKVGDSLVPATRVLRVRRSPGPLALYVQAPGYAPYHGEVVPDQDRLVNIALIPEDQTAPPETPSRPPPKKGRHHRRHRKSEDDG